MDPTGSDFNTMNSDELDSPPYFLFSPVMGETFESEMPFNDILSGDSASTLAPIQLSLSTTNDLEVDRIQSSHFDGRTCTFDQEIPREVHHMNPQQPNLNSQSLGGRVVAREEAEGAYDARNYGFDLNIHDQFPAGFQDAGDQMSSCAPSAQDLNALGLSTDAFPQPDGTSMQEFVSNGEAILTNDVDMAYDLNGGFQIAGYETALYGSSADGGNAAVPTSDDLQRLADTYLQESTSNSQSFTGGIVPQEGVQGILNSNVTHYLDLVYPVTRRPTWMGGHSAGGGNSVEPTADNGASPQTPLESSGNFGVANIAYRKSAQEHPIPVPYQELPNWNPLAVTVKKAWELRGKAWVTHNMELASEFSTAISGFGDRFWVARNTMNRKRVSRVRKNLERLSKDPEIIVAEENSEILGQMHSLIERFKMMSASIEKDNGRAAFSMSQLLQCMCDFHKYGQEVLQNLQNLDLKRIIKDLKAACRILDTDPLRDLFQGYANAVTSQLHSFLNKQKSSYASLFSKVLHTSGLDPGSLFRPAQFL